MSDIQHRTTQSESNVLAQIAPVMFEHDAGGDSLAQSPVTCVVHHGINRVTIEAANLTV